MALGLGLVAKEKGPGGGALDVHFMEAVCEEVVIRLGRIGLLFQFIVKGDSGRILVALEEDFVECGGAESGLDASDAEEVVLSESDALEGEDLLGVDGLVDGQQVSAEAVDGIAVLDGDDGEAGAGEGVFAGVLRCSGLAGGGAGAGGELGVGSVGGELFVGGHRLRGSTARAGGVVGEAGSDSQDRAICGLQQGNHGSVSEFLDCVRDQEVPRLTLQPEQ